QRGCSMRVDVSPSLEEVVALAADHNLIPLRHEFVADCETPVSAFLKLRGDGPACLLESAEQGKRFGRYSFIGFHPREVIRWRLADGGDPHALAVPAVCRGRGRVLRLRPGAPRRAARRSGPGCPAAAGHGVDAE